MRNLGKEEIQLIFKVYEEGDFDYLMDRGLCGTENHHLSKLGLIVKMLVWNEIEGGVEACVYDATKLILGENMPNSIKRDY